MYLRNSIHRHTHTYTHTYIHTYVRTYIHTYIHTYIRMHAYMHTCIHAYIHTCMPTYIHAHICLFIHACEVRLGLVLWPAASAKLGSPGQGSISCPTGQRSAEAVVPALLGNSCRKSPRLTRPGGLCKCGARSCPHDSWHDAVVPYRSIQCSARIELSLPWRAGGHMKSVIVESNHVPMTSVGSEYEAGLLFFSSRFFFEVPCQRDLHGHVACIGDGKSCGHRAAGSLRYVANSAKLFN